MNDADRIHLGGQLWRQPHADYKYPTRRAQIRKIDMTRSDCLPRNCQSDHCQCSVLCAVLLLLATTLTVPGKQSEFAGGKLTNMAITSFL